MDFTEKIGGVYRVLDLSVKADTGKGALLRMNY